MLSRDIKEALISLVVILILGWVLSSIIYLICYAINQDDVVTNKVLKCDHNITLKLGDVHYCLVPIKEH